MIKRATKKQTKVAMERNEAILKKVRKNLRTKGYRFYSEIVGSKCFNTILIDKNGEPYDIDVRIILTHNTKEKKSETIFKDFELVFKSLKNKNFKVNFDNQVIRCSIFNKDKVQYEIEYVIIKEEKILRYDNKSDSRHWCELKQKNEKAYLRFSDYPDNNKINIIENFILPLKFEARKRKDKKPSIALFIEGLNNYENQK